MRVECKFLSSGGINKMVHKHKIVPHKSFFLKLLVLSVAIGFLSDCTGHVDQAQDKAQLQLQTQYDTACSGGHCPCSSPLGLIVDGSTTTAFLASEVTCNQRCQDQEVTLTCNNGKFYRGTAVQDVSQISFSCQVAGCKSCTVGNNQISHGVSVEIYNTSTAACDQSCTNFERPLICVNGTLQGSLQGPSPDGLDPTFNAASCSPANCGCALPGGGLLTVGGSLPFFVNASGTCAAPCSAPANMETRTCTNTGTTQNPVYALSGSSSYGTLSCSGPQPGDCNCVLPDAKKTVLAQGQSQSLFSSSFPNNCMTCTDFQMTVYCDSRVLYNSADPKMRQAIPENTLQAYPNLSCDPNKTVDCGVNNICIANTVAEMLYSTPTLTCAQKITDYEANFSCDSGKLYENSLLYNANTDPNKALWQTSQPTNNCVGCSTPWGVGVQLGTVVTAYKSSGGSSNSCGTGCKSYQFTCQQSGSNYQLVTSDQLVQQDFVTNPTTYTQTCTNACNQEGGGAPPRFCLLPWQNSFVSADSKIPMWNKKSVACGDSCQNHFKVGTCQLSTGVFDAGLSYIYQSCSELPCSGLTVKSISPTYLPPAGGSVTLTGTGFTTVAIVTIANQTCSVKSANGTTLVCVLPKGAGLFQDVNIAVGSNRAVLPLAFSYYAGTCTGGPGTKTFTYGAASLQTFSVPAGCSSILAQVWGAGGGGRSEYDGVTQFGGAGGYSTGVIKTSPGTNLTILVGQGGNAGLFSGASGGGLSGIFSGAPITQANALIIAGGGGGGGDPEGCNIGNTGGEGGGTSGGTHGSCSGGAGTPTTGGAAGAGAVPGGPMAGGAGSTTDHSIAATYGGGGSSPSGVYAGGGGGGGYFGGGGGAPNKTLGGSGGGGSGFINSGIVINGNTILGNGQYPAQMTDPHYVNGVGKGGTYSLGGNGAGGSGLVIIQY